MFTHLQSASFVPRLAMLLRAPDQPVEVRGVANAAATGGPVLNHPRAPVGGDALSRSFMTCRTLPPYFWALGPDVIDSRLLALEVFVLWLASWLTPTQR